MVDTELRTEVSKIRFELDDMRDILMGALSIAARNANNIAELTADMRLAEERAERDRATTRDAIVQLSNEVRSINTEIAGLKGEMRLIKDTINTMANEFRGMRVENQRILRHLFGDETPEPNN